MLFVNANLIRIAALNSETFLERLKAFNASSTIEVQLSFALKPGQNPLGNFPLFNYRLKLGLEISQPSL